MRRVTMSVLGWFGALGVAWIVFVLLKVEDTPLPGAGCCWPW